MTKLAEVLSNAVGDSTRRPISLSVMPSYIAALSCTFVSREPCASSMIGLSVGVFLVMLIVRTFL